MPKQDTDNALTLSLRVDTDTLLASLNEGHELVQVGELDGLAARMAKLNSLWKAAVHEVDSDGGHSRTESLQRYGTAIFTELLPKRIQSFFHNATALVLTLRIDDQLATVDWKSVFDGRENWGRKFRLSVVPNSHGNDGIASVAQTPQDLQRTLRPLIALSYDLKDSTDLMRDWDKEQYSLRLEEMHRQFATTIRRWGGTSDQPQGDDGIMCYFGVHHLREDTVHCALHAAKELAQQAHRMQMPVRFGVATGEIAVSPVHLIGSDIHLAARIQKLAPPGSILTSALTAELARTHFYLEPFSSVGEMKGFEGPQDLYLLHGPKPLHERAPDGQSDSSTLLGRQTEMDLLFDAWAVVKQGMPHWLHLTGEAGIGKSRLASGFVRNIQQVDNSTPLICRCYAETAGRAFSPIVDMLERWFKILPSNSVEVRREKLAQSITQHSLTPNDQMVLSYLLGVPYLDDPNASLLKLQEPRRHFIMRTMAHWLIKQSQNHAVCFVIEDLQWVDPSTLDYLRCLKEEAKGSALLVLLTERRSSSHSLGTRHSLADGHLHLGRL